MKFAVYITVVITFLIRCNIVSAQSDDLKLSVLEQIANTDYRLSFSAITAKILLGENSAQAYLQLDTLLSREYGDMFWMTGCVGLYFSCKDILQVSYKQRIRECWKNFTPYRGDTDNHFLMYYGSLFLLAKSGTLSMQASGSWEDPPKRSG